ncbi:fumarylacetoacetate hydrolase family protein [Halovenus sp. WSH3]|uniref:Fumarylacetoacetate hydrolase family protein n=1 Tax=Halovenus carboxidivorans TaxID=2692199 RepID=A0A6B0T1P6_9EURY|nr:fumarylacetoacetate hydrolase family protein [Halovenus carboxidivorans]MXR52138.1 fumarylacetoacetate hydrolase family protein [Halovenus carboxidivorans]
MKLASFAVDTPVGPQRRVGAVDGDDLVDVTTAYAAALAADGDADPVTIAQAHAPPEMVAFLRRGDRALEAAQTAKTYAAETDDETGPNGGRLVFPEEDVDLLAPVPRPNSLRDFMVYEEHVKNAMGEDPPDVWYEMPVYYKSNADSVVGPGVEVEWPAYSDLMDYELEIAAVIGKEGRDIPAEEAEEYVAGYTIFNDFSARDIQGEEMEARLGPAKGKDFANAFGPYLVTADAFDPEAATMRAKVDGETWSEGTPGEMYHSFADIIEHVSQSETLHPGDVLGSGTVGEGCGLELGKFLESGNTVTLEVDGIGALENTVR